MTISVGDRLPEAEMIRAGEGEPEAVTLEALTKGRKVAIFAVPGAYTSTCTTAHVPSFIRTRDAFAEKGVEEVICVAVNDPFVMGAWGRETGALDANIVMLSDAEAGFTKSIGMDFSFPPRGLIDRSKRYAMLVEDGVVTVLNVEEGPGVCELSAGEALLEKA